jgi:hypothetical protein
MAGGEGVGGFREAGDGEESRGRMTAAAEEEDTTTMMAADRGRKSG